MFGRPSQSFPFCQSTAFDSNTYLAQLQAIFTLLQDSVHTKISASAQQQKFYNDKQSHTCTFVVGTPVWLLAPTRGKLYSYRYS